MPITARFRDHYSVLGGPESVRARVVLNSSSTMLGGPERVRVVLSSSSSSSTLLFSS
jgi:hypothetical protein